MKKIKEILTMVFILSATVGVQASGVRDVVLSTTDRTCSIHYLTHGNTTGWFLTDVEGDCSSGNLSGEGSVVVLDAFGNIEEQLIGYFNQGYWTGIEPIQVPLKTLLLNHDSEEQFLTFDLGGEKRLDIQYLGKMTSTRRSDKTYGPFLTCDPVRILAVTTDTDLFIDESVQQNLISSVVQRARAICPQSMQIQFYAADKDNPQEEDIFFFADIDLEAKHVKVRRIPTVSKTRKVIQIKEKNISLEAEEESLVVSESQHPTKNDVEEITNLSIPTEKKETVLPVLDIDTEIQLDKIPHLLTASRLLKQPVDGKALVHVAYFNDIGEAVVDKPVSLKVKGSGLSLGWGILSGDFIYLQPTGKLNDVRGMVNVLSFVPYEVQE